MSSIGNAELPPIYRSADASSCRAQAQYLTATKVRLGGVLGAAFFALFVWRSNDSPVDWAGVMAAICFFVALLAEVYLLTAKPERTWYEGRAAAESVKTLTWRYMMGGEPLSLAVQPAGADELFLRQIDDVLGVVKELDLVAADPVGQQITEAMRAVRARPLEERRHCYEELRVGEQQDWYSAKAKWNRRRANGWAAAMLFIEGLGILAAIMKAVGMIEADLLGFAGAGVAAMTAWLQTRQHRTLATAYSVTALELASVRSRISHQLSESHWATFVQDAEEAFSREHTMWKASRGVRSI